MAVADVAVVPARPRLPARVRVVRAVTDRLLAVWTALALLFLFAPVFLIVAFSFNDHKGRFNYTWNTFTFKFWEHPFAVEGLRSAFVTSLEVAAISVFVSLVLGTMGALALARHRVHGRGAINAFIFLPLATPDVVMGAALLGFFLTMNVTTGFATIVIAHIMFTVAYVIVTVLARLQGMDSHLEEAAQDLGAGPFTTFRRITLPLIAPGLAAAGLLAFILSIDDFIITNFNAGTSVTFPLYIFGAARQGVPAQVNVLATILLLGALVLMALNLAVQRRRP